MPERNEASKTTAEMSLPLAPAGGDLRFRASKATRNLKNAKKEIFSGKALNNTSPFGSK